MQEQIALTPIYTKGVVLNNGVNIAPLDFSVTVQSMLFARVYFCFANTLIKVAEIGYLP
jgi:hypothetical protein